MGEQTVFNNPASGNIPNSSQDQTGKRLSVQDLYGRSASQPQVSPSSSQQQIVQPPAGNQPINTPSQPTIIPPVYRPPKSPPPSIPGLLTNKIKILIIAGMVLLFIVLVIVFSSRILRRGGQTPIGNATIKYWGLWEEDKTMHSIISDFERKYPTVKIAYEKQDPKQYKERLLARSQNNVGPDVFTYHNSWTPTLTGLLLPLPKDVISPEDFKKDYFPVVQNDLAINGVIYGLPQGMDTLALFINKDDFDAAGIQIPQTWEEFIKAAKTFTVRDEKGQIVKAGAALGTYDNITHASDLLSLLFVQSGVDLNDFSKNVDNAKVAFTFYSPFASGNENVWSDTMNPSRTAFANGELAMYFGYSWDIFTIQSINKNLAFAVYPVPHLATHDQVSIASYWANGVSNKSQHQREALLFVNYLAAKEVMQKLYTESAKVRGFGTPYARVDLAKTLVDNPMIYPFVEQAAYAKSTYFASDTFDTTYNERLNQYLQNAVNEIHAFTSVDTAVDKLVNGIQQVRSSIGLK